MLIGYARVSTDNQNLGLRRDAGRTNLVRPGGRQRMAPLAWFGRKPPPVLRPLYTMFSTSVVVRRNASESLSAGEVLTDRLAGSVANPRALPDRSESRLLPGSGVI